MKKLLLLTAIVSFTATAMAQGKSQKKEQVKTVKTNKSSNTHTNHDNNMNHDNHTNNNGHDGVYPSNQNNTAKYSKNLPTNVRSSFTRDYPNATNVTWTKSQGSWWDPLESTCRHASLSIL